MSELTNRTSDFRTWTENLSENDLGEDILILVIKTNEDKDGWKVELFVICVLIHYTLDSFM